MLNKITILLLALLMTFAMGATKKEDLSNQIKLVPGGNDDTDAADAAEDTAEDSEDGDDVQTITAKVGDTVTLQLDEPIDDDKLTWELIEIHLGFNKIYSLVEEDFVVNEDGAAGIRSFKVKIDSDGEEVITLVRGDMTKFDDANEDYGDSSEHLWNLDLMKGAEYTQVKLTVTA